MVGRRSVILNRILSSPSSISTAFANDPETVVSPVPPTPTRHLLILLKELGQDGTCSDTNPYRGRLGEIAVVG